MDRETTEKLERALAALAGQGKKVDVVEVVRHGDKLVLPHDMTISSALEVLKRKEKYDEEVVRISETIPVFPWDGALAMAKAIEQTYGVVLQEAQEGFFGKSPPSMFAVSVGVTETVQVPWGAFSLPGIEGIVSTGHTTDDGRVVFQCRAEIKRKHEGAIKRLFALTRLIVEKESIYCGKAITLKFNKSDGQPLEIPVVQFLPEGKLSEAIFRRDVEHDIEVNVMTPIRHREVVRATGEYLKRGILLAGRYGTGKTLLAAKISREAVKNGWTFLYIPDVHELPQALRFAQQYQPCVVFAEDIDRVAGLERNDEVNRLLNTLDGIDSKSSDVIVVLTTNYPEKINGAMMRPGRVDIAVQVLPPDAEAVIRLTRYYGNGLVKPNEDLSEVARLLDGQIAAVVAEVVKRSKLESIHRSGNAREIIAADLLSAAKAVKREQELLTGSKTEPQHPAEVVAGMIGRSFGEALVAATGNGNGQEKLLEVALRR